MRISPVLNDQHRPRVADVKPVGVVPRWLTITLRVGFITQGYRCLSARNMVKIRCKLTVIDGETAHREWTIVLDTVHTAWGVEDLDVLEQQGQDDVESLQDLPIVPPEDPFMVWGEDLKSNGQLVEEFGVPIPLSDPLYSELLSYGFLLV